METTKPQDCYLELRHPSTEGLGGKYLIDQQKTALLQNVMQTLEVFYSMQYWNVCQQWKSPFVQRHFQGESRGANQPGSFAVLVRRRDVFFYGCIIPLARRLKGCPVFKATGKELLQYALRKRKEWKEGIHNRIF
jgi:hypothetical protein